MSELLQKSLPQLNYTIAESLLLLSETPEPFFLDQSLCSHQHCFILLLYFAYTFGDRWASGFVAITYHVLVSKAYLFLLFPLQSPSMQVCSRCRLISSCKKFSPISTGSWRLSPSTRTQSCTLPPCCLSGQRQSPGRGKRFHSYLLEPFCWTWSFSPLTSTCL